MSAPPLDLESALNPDQVAAVTHGDGPQLVLAGAGSGKTRVITYRMAWLVREQQVEPWRVAAVTFTNKAAREMEERVAYLSGSADGLFVGTFHRFALRLLRRYGERIGLPRDFTILDTADQRDLIKRALKAENLSETAFPPRMVLARISSAKNKLLTPSEFEAEADGFLETRIASVYRRYSGLLRKERGVDFDDLISGAVRLLEDEEDLGQRMRRRLRFLMVDEFQDTNHAQLALIHALSGSEGNLTAVGDEDQSIYRWRGAEIDNILDFEKSFPGAIVRKLEQNYRSTQTILDGSSELVAHNQRRRGKKLWTDGDPGEKIDLYRAADEGDEARYIANSLEQFHRTFRFRDMAILVRTNAQTRSLEEELIRRQIPYCLIAGTRFYERAEVKDLIAYLRVLRNPQENAALRRILNRPTRGIGKATQETLFREADDLGQSIWDALRLERFGGIGARGTRALRAFRVLIEELRLVGLQLPLPDLLETVLERTGYLSQFNEADPEAAARVENLRELLSAASDFVDDFGHSGKPALQLPTKDPGTAEGEGCEADDAGTGPPAVDAAQRRLILSAPGAESTANVAPTRSETGPDLLDDVGSLEVPVETDPLTGFLDYVSLVSDTDGLDTEVGVSVMTLHSAKGLEFPVVIVAGLEEGLLPHWNSQDSADDIEEERRLLYVGMTRARERLMLTACRRRRVAGRYQDQLDSPFLSEIPEELLEQHESPELFRNHRTDGVYSFFGRKDRRPAVDDPMRGELRKGCKVRHATLGDGVVLDMEGSGDNARLTVFFKSGGKKKLVAGYANLEVC